ncbi:hypothetical protein HSBAA_53540 [Vreelandella sulfidaeris]|uniref:Uncharacterized protein n=1 Tax=Vreelandella sulfidaeris TaxID=115553 RepID=A0A455UI84_9GAMM|nr:hypothetical protein HSBAA_53540 [Halomonas sulfidaeris]
MRSKASRKPCTTKKKSKDGDKEDADQPHAKVSHEEPGNTYDVKAEEKQAAEGRNEERK